MASFRKNCSWPTWLLLALAALVPVSGAADEKRVLVINSSGSVAKFRQVETAFSANLQGKIDRLDLWSDADVDTRVRRALLSQQPHVVFCVGSKAYLATARATQRTPIVFSSTINWRRLPLGKNAFGVASEVPADYQLTTLRHLFSALRKVGVLYSEQYNSETAAIAVQAGRNVGLEILAEAVHRPADLDGALQRLLPRIDALWLIPDPVVLANEPAVKRFFERAREAKVPVVAYDESFIEQGALLAITPDVGTIGTQAALIVEEVLAGQKVQRQVTDPAGSEIILNAKLLPGYGLTLSKDAISSVNRLIR